MMERFIVGYLLIATVIGFINGCLATEFTFKERMLSIGLHTVLTPFFAATAMVAVSVFITSMMFVFGIIPEWSMDHAVELLRFW